MGIRVPWVRGSGAAASGTNTCTPALPATWYYDDIFLLLVETNGQAVDAIVGWDECDESPVSATGTRLTARWRRAQAGDTAPVVNVSAGDHVIARVVAIQGAVRSGSPIHAHASAAGGSSVTATWPTVTTTLNRCLILNCAALPTDIGTARFSAQANASLYSCNEAVDSATATGDGGAIGMEYGEKSQAGAVSATTATLATAAVQALLTLAIAPVSGYTIPAKKVYASDGATLAGSGLMWFGSVVDISPDGRRAMVGASDDWNTDATQRAYIYDGPGWGTETEITDPTGTYGTKVYSFDVAVRNELAVASGSPNNTSYLWVVDPETGGTPVKDFWTGGQVGAWKVAMSRDGSVLARSSYYYGQWYSQHLSIFTRHKDNISLIVQDFVDSGSRYKVNPRLEAYYRLAETSGVDATDVAGRYVGTYVGNPTFGGGPGPAGSKAMTLAGSQYLRVSFGTVLGARGSFAIGLSFKTTVGGTLYCERGSSGNDLIKVWVDTSTGYLNAQRRDDAGASVSYILTSKDCRDGVWHSLYVESTPVDSAGRSDTIRVQVDQVSGYSGYVDVTLNWTDPGTEADFGRDPLDGLYFTGSIAEPWLFVGCPLGATAEQGNSMTASRLNHRGQNGWRCVQSEVANYLGATVAVSADGTVVAAGNPGSVSNETPGSVKVYYGTNFQSTATLAPSGGVNGQRFGDDLRTGSAFSSGGGRGLALSDNGSVIVVGSALANGSVGRAYVFSGATWGTQTILNPSDAYATGLFGTDVGCSNDGSVIAVGCPGATLSGVTGRGTAYVYSGASWGTEEKLNPTQLVPPSGTTSSEGWHYGNRVLVSGGGKIIVVSASGSPADGYGSGHAPTFAYNQGEVFVWSKPASTWGVSTILTTEVVADDSFSESSEFRFGYEVAMTEDASIIVVGAPVMGAPGGGAGVAYIHGDYPTGGPGLTGVRHPHGGA